MRARLAPFSVSLLVLLGACRIGPRPLAVVGEREVTREQLDEAIIAQTGRSLAEVSPKLAGALFENLLEEEVLLAAAPAGATEPLSPAARTARARHLLATLCPAPAPLQEGEIDAYLAGHPGLHTGGQKVRLRQLILPDAATAEAARERLARGEPFEELSRQLSKAPNAAEGGMIGWVERGQLPPKFEVAVSSLAPGTVSEPVESNAGWHLFEVLDRRESGSAADPDLRSRVARQLSAAAAERLRRQCLVTLAARVGVQVNCRDAGFECRNPFEESQ